ncbi:hypothetical protein TNIN_75991, partial [Trichonephila inaurata madagascariensis]
MSFCHDASLNNQTKVESIFENVRDLLSTPGLPPDEHMSQIATQTKSQLINGGNPPLINLWSRQVFSASAE